ncbi:Hypothetical Protein FCC1311_093222 [Hondaea fermentalgiana]|uniref:Uncharacterized protein n=1 Tax=Hondaea fermentalgiana TaxID=2315210 RepID=A0A2R5GTL9_9STRA|nr:Hypothetical Protein FCC1311_093222 [Hondaea fermentalgiana]|eukprot:GBG33098.1 Hypothetical Protein FCC1311_093222 [Hondaea fermentalgiana]
MLDLSEGGDALVVHSFSTNRICKEVRHALSKLHLTTRSSAAANSDDDDEEEEDLEVPNTITVVVITPSLLHDANALRYLCAAVENEESTKIVVRVNGDGDDIFSEAVDVQHMASQVQTDILGMLDRLGVSVSELQKAFEHLAECEHVVCCVENGKPSYFEEKLLRVYTRRALNLVQDGSQLTSGMTSFVGDVYNRSQEHIEERDPDVILFHAERSNLERGIVALLDDHLPNNFACSWLAEEEEEDSDDDEEDDIDEDDIDENIGRNYALVN